MTAAFCKLMQGLVQDLSPIAPGRLLNEQQPGYGRSYREGRPGDGMVVGGGDGLARTRAAYEKAKNVRTRGRERWRRMLKVSQVAERLNCSISTVYSLVESGKLGHHRCPGIRVSEEQLAAFLEGTKKSRGRCLCQDPPAPARDSSTSRSNHAGKSDLSSCRFPQSIPEVLRRLGQVGVDLGDHARVRVPHEHGNRQGIDPGFQQAMAERMAKHGQAKLLRPRQAAALRSFLLASSRSSSAVFWTTSSSPSVRLERGDLPLDLLLGQRESFLLHRSETGADLQGDKSTVDRLGGPGAPLVLRKIGPLGCWRTRRRTISSAVSVR